MDIEIIPTTELLCHTTIFSQLILGASRTTSRLFIDSLIVYNSSIHCFENTKTTNFIFHYDIPNCRTIENEKKTAFSVLKSTVFNFLLSLYAYVLF